MEKTQRQIMPGGETIGISLKKPVAQCLRNMLWGIPKTNLNDLTAPQTEITPTVLYVALSSTGRLTATTPVTSNTTTLGKEDEALTTAPDIAIGHSNANHGVDVFISSNLTSTLPTTSQPCDHSHNSPMGGTVCAQTGIGL